MTKKLILSFAILSFAALFPLSSVNYRTSERYTKSSTAALYYSPNCSHCHKVLDYLKSANKTIQLKNTAIAKYRDELIATGKKGVPTLVVGTQVISGDQQIIAYLQSHSEILQPVK